MRMTRQPSREPVVEPCPSPSHAVDCLVPTVAAEGGGCGHVTGGDAQLEVWRNLKIHPLKWSRDTPEAKSTSLVERPQIDA